ncbi:MAG: patatin-like phospholipase family protein, partial [Bacteroidota bacterium]
MKSSLTILALFFFALMAEGQRVGLVLSGGGARGLAHIGVIKALEENNIPIDFIAGTSAGAVVGCLYSLGYSPTEMDSIVRTREFQSWATGRIGPESNFLFSKPEENASWINLRFALDSTFGRSLPTNVVSSVPYDYALMRGTSAIIARSGYDFDSLFVPFRCVASDIEKKKSVVFSTGDLAQAVRASSAYPFYFRPVNVDGRILYDGGLYNNFPVDVMENEFHPDFIIGVNASGDDAPTDESNLISLLQALMTTPTSFTMIRDKGILIDIETNDIGLFDFSSVGKIVDEGHKAAINLIDSISLSVNRRSIGSDLLSSRKNFRKKIAPIRVKDIDVEGITEKQKEYITNLVKRDTGIVPLDKLKDSYFRLLSDKNIRSVDPKLILDPDDSTYTLHLKVRRERDLITRFGGNISSRPISEAYAGITYLFWGKRAYNFTGNFYFGRLYTSGQTKFRMESPAKRPFFLELDATLNQYDYYRSANAFFTEQRPAYIVKSDYYFGVNSGFAAGNKAVMSISSGYIRLADNYYQTQNFSQSDTADKTYLTGMTAFWSFERNTLNRKQYANEGSSFRIRARYVNVREKTIPGSTSVSKRIDIDHHAWLQANLHYEDYTLTRKYYKLGISLDVTYSNLPLLNNYTVSVVNSPSYEPILEMHTLFLPEFRAPVFAGAGIRNIFSVRSNLDIRLEAY